MGRNKGGDAARACLTLMQLEQHFSSASRRVLLMSKKAVRDPALHREAQRGSPP